MSQSQVLSFFLGTRKARILKPVKGRGYWICLLNDCERYSAILKKGSFRGGDLVIAKPKPCSFWWTSDPPDSKPCSHNITSCLTPRTFLSLAFVQCVHLSFGTVHFWDTAFFKIAFGLAFKMLLTERLKMHLSSLLSLSLNQNASATDRLMCITPS